ncbi:MAG: hypothetical protein ACPG3U_09480 [Rhodothermales bacterium]
MASSQVSDAARGISFKAFESASSRQPGRAPESRRFEVVEATAFRDAGFRELVFLPDVRAAAEDVLLRGFCGAGEAFLAFAVTVRFRLVEADDFLEDADEEPLTKRTGFFARDAVVEEGFRFFDDAIVEWSAVR